MAMIILLFSLIARHVHSFCPDGCGCDEDKLETVCLNTNLQVMPISLNPATKSLILKYNQFQSVDASISFYPSLQNLDLSSNKLKILPGKTFIAQRNLESLNLSDNELEELLDDAFTGLKRLKRLILKTNKISFLKTKALKILRRLEILDLSDNLIFEIHHKAFKRTA